MAKITIVGAGMAGLLAANMLKEDVSAVCEAQDAIPNNHSAVLRFRSSIVGDTLGIPFREVQMMKATEAWRNPVADAHAYAAKTSGAYRLRSSTTANGEIATRYIAPPDLISRMAAPVKSKIKLGEKFRPGEVTGPIISTMPMPLLMKALNYKINPDWFKATAGENIISRVENCDTYASVYVPNPGFPFSRISITGDQLIIECREGATNSMHLPRFLDRAAEIMGLMRNDIVGAEVRPQTYAKIAPMPEEVRREFIMWASQRHNIYSLGRFATWRPGLLLDDLVSDVRTIRRLITNKSEAYRHTMKG